MGLTQNVKLTGLTGGGHGKRGGGGRLGETRSDDDRNTRKVRGVAQRPIMQVNDVPPRPPAPDCFASIRSCVFNLCVTDGSHWWWWWWWTPSPPPLPTPHRKKSTPFVCLI